MYVLMCMYVFCTCMWCTHECAGLHSCTHKVQSRTLFVFPPHSWPNSVETVSPTEQEACHFPLTNKHVLGICLFLPLPHVGSQPCAVMHNFLEVLEIRTQILGLAQRAILSNKLIPSIRFAYLFVVNMIAHLKFFRQAQAS